MSPDQPRDEGGRFTSEGSVSLRDHVDALLAAAKELQSEKWEGHEEAHDLIALALKTQAGENDERLKTMNEWRGTVGDLTAKFVTRETLDSVLKSIAADARARQQWMMTFTLGASVLAVAVATLILRLSGNP